MTAIVITTVEELDALPPETVIALRPFDSPAGARPLIGDKGTWGTWGVVGTDERYQSADLVGRYETITVIHDPTVDASVTATEPSDGEPSVRETLRAAIRTWEQRPLTPRVARTTNEDQLLDVILEALALAPRHAADTATEVRWAVQQEGLHPEDWHWTYEEQARVWAANADGSPLFSREVTYGPLREEA